LWQVDVLVVSGVLLVKGSRVPGTPLHGPPISPLSFPRRRRHQSLLSVRISSFFVVRCRPSSLSSVSDSGGSPPYQPADVERVRVCRWISKAGDGG
jgi:hypothetical protein